MPRNKRKPVVGIALGSGGARGWCHVGVLRALDDLGVQPDVIAGCSMGALVGAAYAGGKLDALEDWLTGLNRTKLLSLIDIRPAGGGLVRGQEILRLFDLLELSGDIASLSRPFTAVATDMETGREVWLREGPVADAVRGSVSIPGLFSPYRHDGRWLLDGGMTNPVPVSACRAMGAEIIIAVNPNAHPDGVMWRADGGAEPLAERLAQVLPESARSWLGLDGATGGGAVPKHFDVVSTAIDIMTAQILRSRLAGEPPQILLNADLSHIQILDLHRSAVAIREGERLVAEHEAQIKRMPGLTAGA